MTQRNGKDFSFLLSAAVILTSFERSRQVALGTPAQKGTFQIALNKYAERVLGMIEMELMEKTKLATGRPPEDGEKATLDSNCQR